MKITDIETKEFDFYTQKNPYLDYFKNKRILITGYKGLIGSGLTKWFLYLNDKYSYNINLYLSSRNPKSLPDWLNEHDNNITLCKFGSEAEAIKPNEELNIIFHLAAPTDKNYFVNEPLDTINSMIEETKQMLELARNKNSKIIYASSVEIYGAVNSNKPVKEDYIASFNPYNIRNCYPIAKLVSEYLCNTYYQKHSCKTVIVRPSSLQGLFQSYNETRIFNEVLRCVIENKNLEMVTDGSTRKTLIYSLDAINAILFVASNGKIGETYNITNPDLFYSMKELGETVFFLFDTNLKVCCLNQFNHKEFADKVDYNLDVSKLSNLGWKPYRDLKNIYSIDIERFKKN